MKKGKNESRKLKFEKMTIATMGSIKGGDQTPSWKGEPFASMTGNLFSILFCREKNQ